MLGVVILSESRPRPMAEASHRAAGFPPKPWERPVHAGWARGGWHSVTDLAVRVAEVATAAKMWTMAILQRSAAEPVGHRRLCYTNM